MEVEVTIRFAASEHSESLARERRLRRFFTAVAASFAASLGVEAEVAPRRPGGFPRVVDAGFTYYSLPKRLEPAVEDGGGGLVLDSVERHR